MAEDGPPLLTANAEGVATLTLNRPLHRNRLHRGDLLALQAHFERLAADPALRVLVLAASGSVFSAGFHLGQLDESPGAAGADPQLFERTAGALEALPVPTIARLQGSVYGGATDLALACDFRVGVHGMVLRMPAARLGLHYAAGGLQRFVSRLGLAGAKRLFLLADEVPAEELLRIGYLDRMVAAAALDDTVAQLVSALAAGAPLALRGMKLSLNEVARGTSDPATLQERERRCAQSADLHEGLAAFAERRAPRFNGR